MATSYTSLLGLALPVTGELSGTWGDTVNNYITQYIDASVAGTQTISGSLTAVTLSKTTNAALSQAGSGATGSSQYQIINCTGNPASELTVTVPAASKEYIVINATSTSQNVKIVGAGPTAGVTVVSGERCLIAWNGSDFVKIGGTNGAGSFTTLTTSSTVTLNGGTANGVAYLNGSKVLTTGSALTFDGANFNAPASIVSGSIGGIYANSYGTGNQQTWLLNNATASDTYRQSDTAQRFRMLTGIGFSWETAASGTAGGAITWSEQMRLTSTGLGIGTSSPGTRLHLKGATNQVSIKLENPQARTFQILSNGSTGGGGASTGSFAIYDETAGADRLTLDSSGNLGLGVTPSAWWSSFKAFQFGSVGSVSSGSGVTNVGHNYFFDGTNVKYLTTDNASYYQQTIGQHRWFTAPSGTAGNAISFTQAMTLDASGNLGVGTTSPQATIVAAGSNATVYKAMILRNSNGSDGSSATIDFETSAGTQGNEAAMAGRIAGLRIGSGTSGALTFSTTSSGTLAERARIDASGNLLVGTTDSSQTTGAGVKIRPAAASISSVNPDSTNSTNTMHMYSTGAGAYRFYVGWGGTISATSATISAISDQRYKENIRDLDTGLNAIMALKPRKFDWKAGKGKDIKDDRGFIAQEFEQVFPDLIDEWKDPAPEGEEPYKSVRQDLIPVLVKAIQELKAELDSVKAELQTLKGN